MNSDIDLTPPSSKDSKSRTYSGGIILTAASVAFSAAAMQTGNPVLTGLSAAFILGTNSYIRGQGKMIPDLKKAENRAEKNYALNHSGPRA